MADIEEKKNQIPAESRQDVHINYDVILETAYPQWISIGSRVQIGIRCTVIAHIHALPPAASNMNDGDYASVRIEDDVNIGPGVIVLPNVTIGEGAVVMAGSVVTKSVPPYSMVQGNPAKVIAKCGIPLGWETPLKEFYKKLRPVTSE